MEDEVDLHNTMRSFADILSGMAIRQTFEYQSL